jgi:hypothetical protein
VELELEAQVERKGREVSSFESSINVTPLKVAWRIIRSKGALLHNLWWDLLMCIYVKKL